MSDSECSGQRRLMPSPALRELGRESVFKVYLPKCLVA